MPLSWSAGGALGGPPDDFGRLLVRQQLLLTDLHDGRKRVALSGYGLGIKARA